MSWIMNQALGYSAKFLGSIGWETIAIIVGLLLFVIAFIAYMTHLMRKAMPFIIAIGIVFIAGGGLSLIKLPEVAKPEPWKVPKITLPTITLPKITVPKLPGISMPGFRKVADAVYKAGERAVHTAKDVFLASWDFFKEHVVDPVVDWFQTPTVDYDALAQAELRRRAEYERSRTLELARLRKARIHAHNEYWRGVVDRVIEEGTQRAIQQDRLEKQEMMRRFYQASAPVRIPGR